MGKGSGAVSSARERRRRNKQEGGGRGRVILKSRSAADLCKKEGKDEVDAEIPPEIRREMDEPKSDPPLRIKGEVKGSNLAKNEREKERSYSADKTDNPILRISSEKDRGMDELDCVPPPLEEVKKKTCEGDITAPSRKEPVIQQSVEHQPRIHRIKSDSDNVELVGVVPVQNGHLSDEVEVEEFFTLLDTTLHLPDSPLCPAPFESEDHPGPPVAAFSTPNQPSSEERTLPPGRLAERIKALRE